jgi:translocation and assembly module TamA
MIWRIVAALLSCSAATLPIAQADEPGEREQDRPPPGAGATFRYDVTISGVENEKLLILLEGVSQLIALRARPPQTLAGLQRRAQEDLERLEATLRSEGFYASGIDHEIDDSARPIVVRLVIALGARYHLSQFEVTYQGETSPEPAERPTAVDLGYEVGMPARAPRIQESQRKLLRLLAERGYPFAKVLDRKAVVDRATNSMVVALKVDSGARGRFGPVTVEGLDGVKQDYVMRLLTWREGEPYDIGKVDAARANLTNTGLFSSVVVKPGTALDAEGRLPITLELAESAHRSFGLGTSYSTDVGVSGEIFWEHRNLFGRGEQLRLAGTAAEIEQSAKTDFRKPNFWRPDQALLSNAAIVRRNTEAFEEQSATGYLGLEIPLGLRWVTTAGVSTGYDVLKDEDGTQKLLLLGLPLTAERNATDNRLNPTRGTRLNLALTPYYGAGDERPLFLTTVAGGSAYLSLDSESRFVLAGRARVGSAIGEPTDKVPANKRFYAGGGGSVRGYEFQSVGPLDASNDPLGGRSLLEVGAELRIRATDSIGLVPFVDGGTVYDSPYPDFEETFRWAAGVGIRYFTGFGPVRLDIALPLDKRKGVDEDFQIYVSFGQAF